MFKILLATLLLTPAAYAEEGNVKAAAQIGAAAVAAGVATHKLSDFAFGTSDEKKKLANRVKALQEAKAKARGTAGRAERRKINKSLAKEADNLKSFNGVARLNRLTGLIASGAAATVVHQWQNPELSAKISSGGYKAKKAAPVAPQADPAETALSAE